MLTLLIAASLQTLPPMPAGFTATTTTKALSPKAAEFKASLGSAMVKTSFVKPLFTTPGFWVTNISVIGGQVNLAWSGGQPLYQVEGALDFNGPWSVVGNPISQTTASFPAGQNHFWRVHQGMASNPPAPGSVQWAKTTSTENNDYAFAVATDSASNVVIGGSRGASVFVEKYDTAGNALWSHQYLTGGQVKGVCVKGGFVYVTGWYSGTANLGGSQIPGSGLAQIFAAKYNLSDGSHVWSAGFPATGGDSFGISIAANDAGDVFITGYISQTDFGNGFIGSGQGPNIFAVKLRRLSDSIYTHAWSQSFGSGTGYGIAIAPNGNIVIAGNSVMANFGGGPVRYDAGGAHTTVAVLADDSAHTHIWSKSYGGSRQDAARALSVAPNGDIALGGIFTSQLSDATHLNFGGPDLITSGAFSINADAYLVELTSAGAFKWQRQFTGYNHNNPSQNSDSNESVNGVCFDSVPDGSGFYPLAVTGPISGDCDYGSGTKLPIQGGSMFVAKYAGDGSYKWAAAFPIIIDVNFNQPNCRVATDASGAAFACGFWGGPSIDFGTGPNTGAGNIDLYLLKLSP